MNKHKETLTVPSLGTATVLYQFSLALDLLLDNGFEARCTIHCPSTPLVTCNMHSAFRSAMRLHKKVCLASTHLNFSR